MLERLTFLMPDHKICGNFLLLKNKKKNVFRDLESVSTSLFNLLNCIIASSQPICANLTA